MTIETIQNEFEKWVSAIDTCDVDTVLELYAEASVLLPTLSNEVCTNAESKARYFTHFLSKEPKCTLVESHMTWLEEGKSASHSGLYQFLLKDGSVADARFTYVHQKQVDGWEIIAHHSSLLPQKS